MNFFFRHPVYCVKSPRKSYAVSKAMREYGKANPTCAWCGRKRKRHIHHEEPISFAPLRAASPDNFVTLCAKRCHLTVGHAGYWRDYVANVVELCVRARVCKRPPKRTEEKR